MLFYIHESLDQIINLDLIIETNNEINISDELILAGKLQLKKSQKMKPEKNQALTVLEPVLEPGRYYQLSYEATYWERGKF